MSFIKISLIALLWSSLCATTAHANEGGEGGGEGGGEKKKEKVEKSQASEYVERTTKLNTIQMRLQDTQKEFGKLIEEKEGEKDQKKKDEIIKQMVDVSKSRNKDVDDYNRVRQELLYQYPAKAAELNRLYRIEEKKNVDEMQSTADIDEMLTRVKRVIEKKFAPFNPENDKPKPAAKATLPPEQPAKLRLEK